MELNVWKLVLDADPVVKFVLLLLASASVVSWAVIFSKVRLLRRSRRNSSQFIDLFWAQKNMETAFRKAERMHFCPVGSVFRAGYHELIKSGEKSSGKRRTDEAADSVLDSIERSLRGSMTSQVTALERRVPFLATTGSSAPFIGLFGTVWGIMNSFLSIGATGSSSLAVVAPGIAEALIATAVGLLAAIPAVIGYNYCVSQIRGIEREMENFSNDFLNVIKRQLGTD